ncbi:MAG: glycosyltransferase family 87 protein [Pseudomonadota bacterium]
MRFALAGIAVQLCLAVMIIATARDGVDAIGIQLGFDFMVYHEAARLALDGKLVAAFDPDVLVAALDKRIPGIAEGYFWLYPPTFAMLIVPLGLLPYGTAFWLWTVLGLSAYGAAAWRLSRDAVATLAAFGYTGVWVAAYHGQNSFFTAGLFMTALTALLNKRDVTAGVAIGLLAMKPHVALIFPLVLAICGRWRAFAAAAATSLAFLGVSTFVMGPDYLAAFIAHTDNYGALVAREVHWMTTPTAFMAMKLLGAPTGAAFAVHVVFAGSVVALTARRLTQHGAVAPTLAMVAGAALTISPYVADYDLTILAAAGLLLFAPRFADKEGPRVVANRDFFVVLAAAMIPVAIAAAGRLGVPIGWLAPAAAVGLAEWRLRSRSAIGHRGFEDAAAEAGRV